MIQMSGPSLGAGCGRSDGERDLYPGMLLVDVLIKVGLDNPVVVEPESFADCVLGDFEAAVQVAPQGSREEEADRECQRARL